MAKEKTKMNTRSDAELEKVVSEKREALRNFRFGISGSKVKNVKEGKAIRKEIARALTEISLRKKPSRVSK